MTTFQNFEEIEAWQKARGLTREIYTISGEGQFERDFVLRDQMRRAGISILSNIAEGFEHEGRREFLHFLSISKGSAAELMAQLYIAWDQRYIEKNEFDRLYALTDTICRMIGGLMRYLAHTDLQGSKFKSTKPGTRNPKPETGFALISAIFLLVVIAALGTFAVTISTTQQQGSALDIMGTRAYQAARAGIEWGAYQALDPLGSSCAGSTTLPAMPGTLADFTVTVTCSTTTPTEAGTTINMYQITSTATQGTVATPTYVERMMSVTIAE